MATAAPRIRTLQRDIDPTTGTRSYGSLPCVVLAVLGALLVSVGNPSPVRAAEGWTFTVLNQATLDQTGAVLPALNNAGQAAYVAAEQISPGTWRRGIHVSNGTLDQTLLEFEGEAGSFVVFGLGLDDSGNVAFVGRTPNESAAGTQLYRVTAGQAVRVPIDLPEFVFKANGDLNEAGELALLRWTSGGDNEIRLRRVDSANLFADRSAAIDFNFSPPESPTINDAGDVGFFIGEQGASLPGFYRLRYRLWRRSTESLEDYTLASPGEAIAPLGESGFNDQRFASTIASRPDLSERLLFWVPSGVEGLTPGVTALIDTEEPNGLISHLNPGTSLSNNNVVAFSGIESSSGEPGIFVRDPVGQLIPVVRTGEVPVDGSGPVGGLGSAGPILGTRSMNDRGQLAFVASLSGQNYLLRADALPGLLPDRPILPDPGDFLEGGGWLLGRGNCGGTAFCWFDPPVVNGYRFAIEASDVGAFAGVIVPAPLPGGDALFTALFNGVSAPLTAGTTLSFSAFTAEPVREFFILGIDDTESLDPDDPTAFVTGLVFAPGSSANLRFAMPEPATSAGWIAGISWFAALARRRRRLD